MALRFREASVDGLSPVTVELPAGSVVGLVGEESAAMTAILELAGGVRRPERGGVTADGAQVWAGPGEEWPEEAAVLALPHLLSRSGWQERVRQRARLEELRRAGTVVVCSSHEPELLTAVCDEVWWIDGGAVAARGAAPEVLALYRRASMERVRTWAAGRSAVLHPSLRRGDGRAVLEAVETLDGEGRTAVVWRSGEPAAVRVRVRYQAAVEDPVVGIMIRTRIGFEVFGTNTELEQITLGPCSAGDVRTVVFRFSCALCPQEYTLTAASHDRDGVWHDWMEDAVAFSVADTRYTAGVANLRAEVTVEGR
ncbi:MAG: Wzt carbohydrate-binding domain-containing protein [Bryobacterales bacterium]|nr:Wzt carbohydrate-binding domain-containing protein [Bryobacterales bacterium]